MARIGLMQRDGSADVEQGMFLHGALEVRIARQLAGMAPVLVRDAAGATTWFLPAAALLAPPVTNIEELVGVVADVARKDAPGG